MLLSLFILQLNAPVVINNPLPIRKEKRNASLNYIVLHSDEGSSYKSTRSFLIRKRNSYHYYIKRNGDIVKMIDPMYKANHAGLSFYKGKFRMNNYSIGIALQNNMRQEYTDRQYASLAWLTCVLRKRYPDSTSSIILRHSDIAIPRGRKNDPGDNFSSTILNSHLTLCSK